MTWTSPDIKQCHNVCVDVEPQNFFSAQFFAPPVKYKFKYLDCVVFVVVWYMIFFMHFPSANTSSFSAQKMLFFSLLFKLCITNKQICMLCCYCRGASCCSGNALRRALLFVMLWIFQWEKKGKRARKIIIHIDANVFSMTPSTGTRWKRATHELAFNMTVQKWTHANGVSIYIDNETSSQLHVKGETALLKLDKQTNYDLYIDEHPRKPFFVPNWIPHRTTKVNAIW